MKTRIITMKAWLVSLAFTCVSLTQAQAMEFDNLPLESYLVAKPNIIFGLDDSGSMDFEILLNTSGGGLWWEGSSRTFVDANGNLLYNDSGSAGRDGWRRWYQYVYLFPNGTGSDRRQYSDGSYSMFALPPTPEFAIARSPDYNAIYYNTHVTYKPWSRAYVSGAVKEFSQADPNDAVSHPIFTTGYSGHKLDLASTQFSTRNDYTFRMISGMQIPGADIPGIKRKSGWRDWTSITSNTTVPSGDSWDVAIPYYPATFYLIDSTCTASGLECATAPDGNRLRRYEIKPGVTFPSGRSAEEELKNFANWYSYYRKRKLMLSSAMSQVMAEINGIRGGVVQFNDQNPVTMYDFDNGNPAQNRMRLLGQIYSNPAQGGTPTRDTLDYIGNQFKTNTNIIEKACQFNAAMVLTDGFASRGGPNVRSYDRTTWASGTPYQQLTQNSLADIALSYYTKNLRPDLESGKVPISTDTSNPNVDQNPNLHMNTYALSIGPRGFIYGTDLPEFLDPFTHAPDWPVDDGNGTPASIDDLWHATINGRGKMTDASNPVDLVTAVRDMLFDVIDKASASSAIGAADVYLNSNNNAIYAASHHIGYGELKKYLVNLTNGEILGSSPVWSSNTYLDQIAPENRKIATYNGTQGIPFQYSQLADDMKQWLTTTYADGTVKQTSQDMVAWLRGASDLNSSTFRARAHMLGSIVHAKPVVVLGPNKNYSENNYYAFKTQYGQRTPMVYQAANDGMLHAFEVDTGHEAWAYIPRNTMQKLPNLAAVDFVHEFVIDATPAVADVYFNNNWHTLLVGGHGAGGRGYYALDVSQSDAASEDELATKVLWEFPNSATPISVAQNIGHAFGKPKLIKTKAAGWVVLVTSGYTGSTADGKGHLFVLDPNTGAVLKDLVTSDGSSASPAGLNHIATYATNAQFDPLVEIAYGGDLLGNVWRFDFSGATLNDWNVRKLATLVDNTGVAQPVTSEPELQSFFNKRVVYVGTGKLLGQADLSNLATQTIYALVDDASDTPLINPLRGNLKSVATTDNTGSRGWYLDLQTAGERIDSDPALALDKLILTANKPSSDGCSTENYQYLLTLNTTTVDTSLLSDETGETDLTTEVPLPIPTFTRTYNGNTLASEPSLVVLPGDTLVTVTHNADNTFTTAEVGNQQGSPTTNAIAWREVLRD